MRKQNQEQSPIASEGLSNHLRRRNGWTRVRKHILNLSICSDGKKFTNSKIKTHGLWSQRWQTKKKER